MPPNIAKLGEPPLVEITALVSPLAYVASILKSSPAPVGMFLICNAAVHRTAPLVVGVTGDFRQSGRNAANAEDVVGSVHEMRDSTEIWNRPQAWSTRMLPAMSGTWVPP